METINSMASTAAKAIWGDNNNSNNNNENKDNTKTGTENMTSETKGTEPVSGKLGDTSAGEPFDAGNIESGAANTTSSTAPSTTQAGSESTTSGLPTTSSTDATNTESKDSTDTAAKGPTADHPSTTGNTGFKAPQADIRDPDSATADPKKEAERKNVDDSGGLDTSENPGKLEGAGPKPIEEVAKSHGGDAGSAGKDSSAAGSAGEEDGPGAKSQGEGTGEQYVKSSGLAADGGDFDATKPGAGREADRLMEEKGMTTQSAAAAASGKKTEDDKADKTTPDSPDSKKEKASLKDKIKAKLHKN